MEFNNLADILGCMKEWEQIRKNSAEVVNFLNIGNYFSLMRNKPTAANLHAYPGISVVNNEFYMFIIDADDDRNNSETDLFNAITICRVKNNLGNSDQIPEDEAKRRIDNWKRGFSEWATFQVTHEQQTRGIFKAFNVPSAYMEPDVEYSTFFALKPDGSSMSGYDADLVTSKASTAYFDTVRPVPPFDVYSQNSFHLLSLV